MKAVFYIAAAVCIGLFMQGQTAMSFLVWILLIGSLPAVRRSILAKTGDK